jgi:5-methylcytosine-specific restriction endonuclease McrA
MRPVGKEYSERDTRYIQDVAYCPWCFAPQHQVDDGDDEGYEGEEYECTNCGRKFIVDVDVEITRFFTTEKMEESYTEEELEEIQQRELRKPIPGQMDLWGNEVPTDESCKISTQTSV